MYKRQEYNCESMLESNRIFDASNSMDEFSFFEVMKHWRTDKLDMSGSNNQCNGTGWGFMVPQKKLYDAFVQEEGVDGYRLNQTMKMCIRDRCSIDYYEERKRKR